MADSSFKFNPSLSSKILQRTLLLGRVKMAQAIHMPEPEWAKLIAEVEKDSLFRDVLSARSGEKWLIQYKRFPRSSLSSQFYETRDIPVAGGPGQLPPALLEQEQRLLSLIEKIGQSKFETFFLYREEGVSVEDCARQCGLTESEAKEIQDGILELSIHCHVLHPSQLQGRSTTRPTLVGQILRNEQGLHTVSFLSPHMARGQYEIDHDGLKQWQKKKKLSRQDAARIRKFVGILEMANLKQGAFWRVMDYLLVLHKDFFETKDPSRLSPASLRKVARHLQFAPSTISRVMGNKSIRLPWGHEVLISDLMPGQRKVVLHILDKVLALQKKPATDMELARQIAEDYGIRVSRRTITACRHALTPDSAQSKAA